MTHFSSTPAEQLGFRALTDPTRRNILYLLAASELTIGEVAKNFQMTRAAVKKHLTVLSDGGLITVRTVGRSKINALNTAGIKRITDWFSYFDGFWDERRATLKTQI